MKAVCCSALSSGGAVVRVTAIANIQRSRIRSYRCSAYRSERGQSGICANRKLVSVIGEVAMNVRYDHGALANS